MTIEGRRDDSIVPAASSSVCELCVRPTACVLCVATISPTLAARRSLDAATPRQMTLVRAVILPLLLLLAAPVPCLRLVGDAVALGRRGALWLPGAAALRAGAVAEARLEDTLQMRDVEQRAAVGRPEGRPGGEVQKGDRIWVEYMMTRRGGAKIYSTKQACSSPSRGCSATAPSSTSSS